MKKYAFIITILASVIYSCSSNSSEKSNEVVEEKDTIVDTYEERLALIEETTKQLQADSLKFNRYLATKLVDAYADFIANHPAEEQVIDFTFKAGDISRALQQPHEAIRFFNMVIDKYPDSEKAPMALFYKAMVLGDDIQDIDAAKATYQEFIEKYPNHEFAESAKASIEHLGKSLEEIVAGFEEKNS